MFLEDIRENPKVALVRLAEHIGVDPRHFFAANDSQLRTPIFTGPGLDVRSALLNQLRELYRDEIAELSQLLERDLTMWNDWDGRR